MTPHDPTPLEPDSAPALTPANTSAATPTAAAPGLRRLLLFVGAPLAGEAEVGAAMARTGWRCLWLPDVAAAQQAAAHARFDAVLLRAECDGGPPPRDIDALRRALGCPVLVAAGAGDEVDEVIALELGADAWLAGRLTARRLRAHLAAVLRPREAAAGAPIGLGLWTLDEAARRLERGERRVLLTGLQVALLRCLAEQAGRVVSRDALAQAAGGGRALQARSVDVYVARLRRRLRDARVEGLDIEGVRGRGYTLEIGVAPAAAGLRWPWVPRPAAGVSPAVA